MHHNGYPFVKNFPGVTCQNTSKCIKMDVNFKKVREWLVKMAQNAPKWISVFQKFHGSYLSKYLKVHENGCQFKKKIREWLVKMAQNAPKWISVFQKFSRDEVRKYFKMHQNGCKCKKKFQG